MLIIGIVYAVKTARDKRGHDVASYRSSIDLWQQNTSGAKSFYNAFSNASLVLSVTLTVSASITSLWMTADARTTGTQPGSDDI